MFYNMATTRCLLLSLVTLLSFVDVFADSASDQKLLNQIRTDCSVPFKLGDQCPIFDGGIQCLEKFLEQAEGQVKRRVEFNINQLKRQKAECPAVKCLKTKISDCKKDFLHLQYEQGYKGSCSVVPKTLKCLEGLDKLCKSKNGSRLYAEVHYFQGDMEKCDSDYFKDFPPLKECLRKAWVCQNDLAAAKSIHEETQKDLINTCDKIQPPAAKCIGQFKSVCQYRDRRLQDVYDFIRDIGFECESSAVIGPCSFHAIDACLQIAKENGKYVCGTKVPVVVSYQLLDTIVIKKLIADDGRKSETGLYDHTI